MVDKVEGVSSDVGTKEVVEGAATDAEAEDPGDTEDTVVTVEGAATDPADMVEDVDPDEDSFLDTEMLTKQKWSKYLILQ